MPHFSERFLGRKAPSYRRHKASGQAIVTIDGRDHYLGPHGTAASRAQYDRVIGEWLAAGRQRPPEPDALTVAELLVRYRRFARGYYVKNGRPTSEPAAIDAAIRAVRLYDRQPAASFGPLALKNVQQQWIAADLCRGVVNQHTGRIKRMFRWAASEELLPVAVYQALATVPGLRIGRTKAREPSPVRPVADGVIEATLPFLPPVVADMVRFQRLTGARPGEVCQIRPCDVDVSGDVWIFTPESHKTEHHGRERRIFIGPRAQDVLRPYLLRPADSHCFDPADSEKKRRQAMREARRSKVQPSQQDRRRRKPKWAPGSTYRRDSYTRAVVRGVEKANEAERAAAAEAGRDPLPLPVWRPNQLRHTRATELRAQFGIEAARVTLGHRDPGITLVYAEADLSLAADVARKTG